MRACSPQLHQTGLGVSSAAARTMNWPAVAATVVLAGSAQVSQAMLGRGNTALSPAQRESVKALELRRRVIARSIAIAAVVVWVGLLYSRFGFSTLAIPWFFLGAVCAVACAQLFHLRRLRRLNLPAHYFRVWWNSRIPMCLGWMVATGIAMYTSWFRR
jgi:hypothetical protein